MRLKNTFARSLLNAIQLNGYTAPAGGATGYAVYINSTNSFTAPANGTEPVADLSWNAAGQQCIYFGTSASPTVTVTGLTGRATYYFKVYAYNECLGIETYETIGLAGNKEASSPMTLVFDTNLGDGTTVTLPLYISVNVTVDWGDGSIETVTTAGNKNHTYASEGTYTVNIYGLLERFGTGSYSNADKLVRVTSFGDLNLISLASAFNNAVNLIEVPSVLPPTVTYLYNTFDNCSPFNLDISNWNVSNVISMTDMFNGVTLSTTNYDALLTSWATQTVKRNVYFHGGNSKYSSAAVASRGTLTGAPNNWIITDGGLLVAPELNVKQNTTSIADGTGSYDFGSKSTSTNTDIVFTIENTGIVASTLGSFSISGTNADQFSFQGTSPTTVTNGSSLTFTVRFTPSSVGAKTAMVSFDNQDADENPYNFALNGTGVIITTWNGAAWSNGVPDVTKDAILAANYRGNTNLVCMDLTINNSAVLTIYPNITVTVNGTLTNNNGTAGLVIKSDATGTGSLIHNTASVPASVERHALQNRTLYFSSAVADAKSNSFAGALGLYKFNAALVTPAWAAVTIDDVNVLTSGNGFAVKYTDNAPDIKFIGYLNTGEVSPAISHNILGYNWNLVGNPYPSAVDWDASGWTKTGINNAIYLRTGTNTVATYSGGTGTNSGSRYIASGQGFWVRTISNSPVLTFTNPVRVHNSVSLLKGTNANILRLNVDAENYSDEIAIALNDNASNGIDALDAYKMFSNGNFPELYLLVDNKEMVINQLSASEMPSLVNLGVKASSVGTYTLRANLSEFANYSGAIALVDNLLSKRIDLRITPTYAFTSAVGSVNNRFAIEFTKNATGITEAKASKTQIFATQNLIHVRFSEATSAQVDVMDLLGRVLISKKVNDKDNSLSSNGLSGVYLVRVKTEKGILTEKVFLQE